ncbi:MAG: type VI secretion system tube protein Hcp [Sinomicrobium sp.]|nr:type VI secretion system tube protein Hcp [Sinomicrobium sp.]
MKKAHFSLLLFCLFLFTGIASAQRMYIKIDGVDGEATERNHRNWIDLQSYKQGVSSEAGVTTGAARMRAGKTSFGDLVIVKKIDKTSPVLMQKCAGGEVIPKVELEITEPNGNSFYKVIMDEVRITGVTVSSDCSSGCQTMEEVSFYYNKITWEHTGSSGKTQAGYDIKMNRKL